MPFGKKSCFGEVDYFVSISDPKVCSNHLMLHVSQTASYEISCVHRVCLCLRLSLSFLRIGSLLLFFFDIVQDSWPWCLVTDEARFLKKSCLLEKYPVLGKWTILCPFRTQRYAVIIWSSTSARQRPMNSLVSIWPCVCLSVCPSACH